MNNEHSGYPMILSPEEHPKFINTIPHPERIDLSKKSNTIKIKMKDTVQWLGLVDEHGTKIYTPVWGYQSPNCKKITYPGPTIIAKTNHSVHIQWQNKLPNHHLIAIDKSIHTAIPSHNGVPTVTHLHGGTPESASDGLPDAWFTHNFRDTGADFIKKTYHYDNNQIGGAALWYHDHALGFTRTNVYSGLAGFYLLRNDNEEKLIQNKVLPCKHYELEMVVQDRDFTEYGDLFLPSDPDSSENEPSPSIFPEFFGNYILVNGMTWPIWNVEPTKYRIRLLNGSDSRFYIFRFDNDMSFMQIGTDNGLLEYPVVLNSLVLAPGERADLILDFSEYKSTDIILKNFGPDEPFKGFNDDDSLDDGDGGSLPYANPESTGLIMKFSVCDKSKSVSSINENSRLTYLDEIPMPTVPTRQLVLFEGSDQYSRIRPILGTFDGGSYTWGDPITEMISHNSVEIWEIFNTTADAHPIHIHSITFRALDRQKFDGTVIIDGTDSTGGTKQKFIFNDYVGPILPINANENGNKDTIIMFPGQVTRVIAKYNRAGKFVWHCHILSHEDHEMMRPIEIQ